MTTKDIMPKDARKCWISMQNEATKDPNWRQTWSKRILLTNRVKKSQIQRWIEKNQKNYVGTLHHAIHPKDGWVAYYE